MQLICWLVVYVLRLLIRMTDFAMLLNISSICIGLVGSYSVCNIADYIGKLFFVVGVFH